jgi:hypothetical protein
MKTITKWILGILIALVILAALAAIGYLVFSQWNWAGWRMDARLFRMWEGGRHMPWRGMPMMPFWSAPGQRLGGFFPLRWIANWLVCPGILFLIVLGVVALVLSLRRSPAPSVSPVSTASTAPAAAPTPVQAVSQTCPNCGRPVNTDWRHCPYCGTALA